MRATLTVAALLAFPSLGAATVSESHFEPIKPRCTAKVFRAWSAKVWRPSNWERGMPPHKVIAAQRRRLACAGPGNRKAMKNAWRRSKTAYFKYRGYRRRNPYYGCTSYSGCQYYALPAPVVECESSGRFHDPSAPNGGYSLLDKPRQGVPTWETWRPSWASGYAEPYEAPRRAQDEATEDLVGAYGLEPWECA